MGRRVRWRHEGLLDPAASDGLLRFASSDLNMVIKKAAADADLYRDVAAHAGHPGCEALVLSTYAITSDHPVEDLTAAWAGRGFLVANASDLRAAGIEVWPTAVSVDDVPDPHNAVHFDVIVQVGPAVVPAGMGGTKTERREARESLRPSFDAVLRHFAD